MVEKGADVRRLSFNGGDVLFAFNSKQEIIRDVRDFETLFDQVLDDFSPDVVVLFGDERPVHRAAIAAADRLSIPVWCFEEGYVRPNYVTFEPGGNNANSKLVKAFNAAEVQPIPETPPSISRLTLSMSFAAVAYFVAHRLSQHLFVGYVHHRERMLHKELRYWLRGLARRIRARRRDNNLVKQLVSGGVNNFFLVALQVHDDLQLLRHGLGWKVTPFVETVLRSFAQCAPDDCHLVIKAHPLDLGHGHHRKKITRLVEQHGIQGRVHFLCSGPLGPLLRRSRGLITINSTAGLASLSNGIPTLAFGNALYQMKGLVDRPSTESDLDDFWCNPTEVNQKLASEFHRYIINTLLLPGSFYVKSTWPSLAERVYDRLAGAVRSSQKFSDIKTTEPSPPQKIGILSSGIWKQRKTVEKLFGAKAIRLRPWSQPSCDMIAGWGHKATSERARRVAFESGKLYVAMEDGFIRSIKPGPLERSISWIIDRTGIFYDGSTPSDLERAVLRRASSDTPDHSRIKDVLHTIQRCRLSKYNHAPMLSASALRLPRARDVIAVFDQTFGDASVAGANADQSTFTCMLEAAVSENPGRTIVVKAHPETVSKLKRAYLTEACQGRQIALVQANVNPWALIEMAARVYVVSSQAGMEAALAGVPVTCFGRAAYSGWGFTDDRFDPVLRRDKTASRESFAEAAYLDYCKWLDLYSGDLTDIELAIDQLTFARDKFLANRKTICVGLSRWKQKAISPFLDGVDGPPEFVSSVSQAIKRSSGSRSRIIVWGDQHSTAIANTPNIRVVRAEDGFLRSVGLGASFVAPASLVFDRTGLYYDPRQQSDFEAIAQTASFSSDLLERARCLRKKITENGISKYNEGVSATLKTDTKRVRILVPGQVEDDASVRLGSPNIKTNLDLLRRVRQRWPDGFIIFKQHPDVQAGYRAGKVPEAVARKYADAVVADVAMPSLLQQVDRVETMTSLTGFEALLRGLPVTTHGTPFYSGWGLTEDLAPCSRRLRALTIDELTAVALILYPSYVDPETGLPCEVETVVDRFTDLRSAPPTGLENFRISLRNKAAWLSHNTWGAVRRFRRRLQRKADIPKTRSRVLQPHASWRSPS